MNNIEIIQELYRAVREKDYEAFRKICALEVKWIQNEGFPNGATHTGPDAVIKGVFEALHDNWAPWRFQIEEFLDAGSSVAALGFYEGIHKVTQKLFHAAAIHVFDFADSKVVKFRQFADTKVIWDAMV